FCRFVQAGVSRHIVHRCQPGKQLLADLLFLLGLDFLGFTHLSLDALVFVIEVTSESPAVDVQRVEELFVKLVLETLCRNMKCIAIARLRIHAVGRWWQSFRRQITWFRHLCFPSPPLTQGPSIDEAKGRFLLEASKSRHTATPESAAGRTRFPNGF